MSWFSQVLAHENGSLPAYLGQPPVTIIAALDFDSNDFPSVEDLENLIVDHLAKQFRFISHVEREGNALKFVPNASIDVHHHLIDQTIKEGELREYVASIYNRDWKKENEMKMPLWYCHRLKGPKTSHIVLEVHHCIGDGLSMLDLAKASATKADGSRPEMDLKKFMPKPTNDSVAVKLIKIIIFACRMVIAFLIIALRAFFWKDSPSALQSKDGTFPSSHRLYCFNPIPLDRIKRIKAQHKASINDVVTSIFSGAIHRYLASHGSFPNQLRFLFPFSLLRKTTPDDLCKNGWTMVSCQMVLGDMPAAERIKKTTQNTEWFKISGEPFVMRLFQRWVFELLGHELAVKVYYWVVSKHSLFFTNVPGFEYPIYVCGKKVLAVRPSMASLYPTFAAVSYAGDIFPTLTADSRQDFSKLDEYLSKELEELDPSGQRED